MSEQHYKYVVVGGGQAAGYAAREFVSGGVKPGELLIIGKEDYVSYERPTLSKAYCKPEGPKLPAFHATVGGGGEKQEPAWYKEKGIEYLTGTTVTSADIKNKSISTDKGQTFSYDKLMIATGSTNITLDTFGAKNAKLNGIYYLRDIADGDALNKGIADAKKKNKEVVIVGGGYIGMEVSSMLKPHGLNITLVFPEDRLMSRLFTPEIASYYEKYYEEKGIKLLKGKLASGFVDAGDGSVKAVELKDGGSLPADLVVVGAGAKPNTDLFDGQLDLLEEKPGGIKTNAQLQTSHPDVYAVGDIAAFPQTLYGGGSSRQEHVQHARNSAAFAASEMMAPGKRGEYNYLPYFYSREFDRAWQFYGVNQGEPVFFGDASSGKFGSYWIDNGKVVGAFLESGSGDENNAIKQVATVRPSAPSKDELSKAGLDFATKASQKSATTVASVGSSYSSSQALGDMAVIGGFILAAFAVRRLRNLAYNR
ncbi:hypothetical protein WJX84_010829 [Apatococcus fuscideae]|uniref:monodehydroascorbate reductase (NADH) n=1 Tax=Apatococcus fuscideae TaxID=2026836 RepID=A0AAW1SSD4_9CHLO